MVSAWMRFRAIFHSLTIRTQLSTFIFLPLLAILAFGGMQIGHNYAQWGAARSNQKSVHAMEVLSQLLDQLQVERALSAGYVASKGELFSLELQTQRVRTDNTVNEFVILHNQLAVDFIPRLPQSVSIGIEQTRYRIDAYLSDLHMQREATDLLKDADLFSYYSQLNNDLLLLVEQLQIQSEDIVLPEYHRDLLNLLWVQEHAAQEKGKINGVFSAETLDITDFQEIGRYIAGQESLIITFFSSANKDHQVLLAELLDDPVVEQVESIRAQAKEKIYQYELLNEIRKQIGYGGLIHNFKNYVIRGEQQYVDNFQEQLNVVFSTIEKFESSHRGNAVNQQAIYAIKQTFLEYQEKMAMAVELKKQNKDVESIDRLVRVVDDQALSAIVHLEIQSAQLNTEQWWEAASQRIAIFKRVTLHVLETMQNKANELEASNAHRLMITFLFFSITLLITLFVGCLLWQRIVGKIKAIATAMKNMQKTRDFDKYLEVSGSDEIAQMASAYNSMLDERKESNRLFTLSAAVFEHAAEAIMITSNNNVIEVVNPAFTKISGYSAEEVMGKTPAILKSGRQDDNFYKKMWNTLVENDCWEGEIWNKRKNGDIYPEYLSISVVKDSEGNITQFISMFSDITKRKKYEQNIWYQANFDQLTGLPNRKYCMERLFEEIQGAARNEAQVGLMFLDLDRFKLINDTLGHTAGDELLQLVATRLRLCLREDDIVARIGGDEFVAILPNIKNRLETERVAQKVINLLSSPFTLGQHYESVVSTSIGMTLFPQDGTCVETLLRNADTAMYQAKDEGRNTYRFYSEQMNIDVVNRMQLEQDLRRAITNHEFQLYYQPIVSLKTGIIVGAEALIRWHHPDKGLIFPDTFIGISEETGLIEPIGEWVIHQALEDLKRWHDMGHVISVSVNVSSRQCTHNRDKKLDEIVTNKLQHTNIHPDYFHIEMTESVLLGEDKAGVDMIRCLRDMGVAIHMDDFGTGYSSLSYLKRFPLDVIKIDRSFIDGVLNDKSDASLVEAVITLGHNLNLRIVGEGIESKEHYDYLKQLGCDFGQGYYMAKPLPFKQFVALLEESPHAFVPAIEFS